MHTECYGVCLCTSLCAQNALVITYVLFVGRAGLMNNSAALLVKLLFIINATVKNLMAKLCQLHIIMCQNSGCQITNGFVILAIIKVLKNFVAQSQ